MIDPRDPRNDTLEAERTLVGVCIKRPEMINRATESIRNTDFSNTPCRMVFDAVMSIHAQGKEVDIVTVGDECGKMFPGVDLVNTMIECATREYRAAAVEQYCAIIAESSQRRAVRAVAERLIASVMMPDYDLPQLVEDARRELGSTVRTRGEWVDISDVLLATFEDIEERAKGKREPCVSGISTLDALTGGFMPGEFTIIGARPSVGKTALAINSAIASALRGKHVAFVSAEMINTQLGQRLFSDAANINGMRLRRPECMDEKDWMALSEGLVAFSRIPIKFLFTQRHIEDIVAQARRLHDSGLNDMLVVDYIQLLGTRAKFSAGEDRLRVGYISQQLAELSKDLKIPVIGLAQLTRQYKEHATMPRLDSLKDSGSQEQDADSVILMHEPDCREDEDLRDEERSMFDSYVDTPKRIKLLNVAKQRQGEKGIVCTVYDGSRNRFAPIERKGNN